MSFKKEWQLVAHQPDLTPAEGAVAQAIARRIKPDNLSERIPIRTLLAESVGVKSKDTIERALVKLESLGVIRLSKPPKGSRQATLISWVFSCPENCQIDHERGNKKLSTPKATRPNPQDTTRPNPQDALRIKERERSSLVSLIYDTLKELPNPSSQHLDLLAAIDNPVEVAEIRARTEQLAIKANHDPHSYLKAIAISEPWKLRPKPKPAQAPPDFSHLPPEIAEAQRRKLERLSQWVI